MDGPIDVATVAVKLAAYARSYPPKSRAVRIALDGHGPAIDELSGGEAELSRHLTNQVIHVPEAFSSGLWPLQSALDK